MNVNHCENKPIFKEKDFETNNQNNERKNFNSISNSKSITSDNNQGNLNTREKDLNSIMNFMNSLNIPTYNDISNNSNNNNSHKNYQGEINEINNKIECNNERLKLNEINKNFILAKIENRKLNINN